MDLRKLEEIPELKEENKQVVINLYHFLKNKISVLKKLDLDDITADHYKYFFDQKLMKLFFDIASIYGDLEEFKNLNTENKINVIIVSLIYIICYELKLDENTRELIIELINYTIPVVFNEENIKYTYEVLKKIIRKLKIKKILRCCIPKKKKRDNKVRYITKV
jgi:hypothetical protein